MHITFVYAALFGLLFVALSVRALRLQVKLGITIGDAGCKALPQGSSISYACACCLVGLRTLTESAR
jgi:uncharacterized membrane protein YecN with MAPEG domain